MRSKTAKILCLLLLIAWLPALLPPRPVSAAEDDARRPQYRLNVDLDFSAARLVVEETVRYTNRSSDTLRSLVFAVTPAYYNAFKLDKALVAGKPVQTQLTGRMLEVSLATPLAPGDVVEATLNFTVTVPSPGTQRFGFSQGILALGNWYPVIAVYRPQSGWDRSQYIETGDAFFTESADYDVRLTTDRDVVVAHSGDDAGSWAGNWHFSLKQGRDFAMAMSRRYVTRTRTINGVTLTAFSLPEHSSQAAQYLETGAESLAWFSQTLGSYPYRTLHLAETVGPEAMGQEYPGMIFISTGATALGGGMGSSLSYLVAHEVAHQWFYGVVGDDQELEPWLDEAFASYLPYLFWAANYPSLYPSAWARYQTRAANEQAMFGRFAIDRSIYDFANEGAYFATVYRRGALFLDDLRGILGEQGFLNLLRDFVARYRFGIARGDDFLALAASRAPETARLVPTYFANATLPTGLDVPVPNGHFFKQANGRGGAGDLGFAVTNDDNVRFWDEFQRVGGVAAVGYPISRRFQMDGFTVQAFQKAILQWHPENQRVAFLNVLDLLSEAGRDDWLQVQRQTPPPLDTSSDRYLDWDAVIRKHLQLADRFPTIRQSFLSEPQWLDRYGLPMATADYDSVSVLRAQRAVFQLWKVDTPWAQAGQVTIANGGDLAKESGLLPSDALAPQPNPRS